MSRGCLFLFARAPEPGRVKTRLAAALGAEAAARLHRAFLDDTCALTREVRARRVLSVAGDPSHPEIARLASREGIECVAQCEGDLGVRMAAAIELGISWRETKVVIIGTDAPALPPVYLIRAFDALDSSDVVIGPAEDGGYWLVGARAPMPWLFEDMPWSTDRVLPETERRLAERSRHVGLRHRLVDRFWDVDEPADLVRLRAALDADPRLAPATRATLDAMR